MEIQTSEGNVYKEVPMKKDNKTTRENQKIEENQKRIDAYDYLSNAASSQDCTGLIPSQPASDEELEAYEDLYHFLPPNGKAENIKDK